MSLTNSDRTGRKIITVAVLLANSVKKAITIVMRITATGGGIFSRGLRRLPIQMDKPDSCNEEESPEGSIRNFLGLASCIGHSALVMR